MFRGPGVPTQCHPCHSVACAQCFHAFRNLHKYGALGLKNGPKGVLRQRGHTVRLAFDRGHAVRLVLALDHGHAGLKMADAPATTSMHARHHPDLGRPRFPGPKPKTREAFRLFPKRGITRPTKVKDTVKNRLHLNRRQAQRTPMSRNKFGYLPVVQQHATNCWFFPPGAGRRERRLLCTLLNYLAPGNRETT